MKKNIIFTILTIISIFLISIIYVSATSHVDDVDDCDVEGVDHVDDGECDDGHEDTGIPQDYCGDGTCSEAEKYANDPCPADCCGDGFCSPNEEQYCSGDCSDVGPDPVVEGYPPCEPGDVAVCHEDCSCRCESSYSGPNYASSCPNSPEETPVEVTPPPDDVYDVGITNVIAPYPELGFLESVIFDFEIKNYASDTSVNWDVELYNANHLLVGTKNGDTSTLSPEETETVRVTFPGTAAGTFEINIVVVPNSGVDADPSDNAVEGGVYAVIRPSTEPEVIIDRGTTLGTNPVIDDPIDGTYDAGISNMFTPAYTYWELSEPVIMDFEIKNYASDTSVNWDVVLFDVDNNVVSFQSGDTSILSIDQTEIINLVFSDLQVGEYEFNIVVASNNGVDADTSDNQVDRFPFTVGTDTVIGGGTEGPTGDIFYDGGILEVTNVVYDSNTKQFNFDVIIKNYAEPAAFGLDVSVVDSSGTTVAEIGGLTQIINTQEQETFEGFIQTPVLAAGDYYIAVQLYPLDTNENVVTDEDERDNAGYSNQFNIGASGGLSGTDRPALSVDIAVTNFNAPKSASIDSTVDITFTIQSLDGTLSDAGEINYGFGIFDVDENVLYQPEETRSLTDGRIKFSFNPKSVGLATDIPYLMGVFAGPETFEDYDPTNNVIIGMNYKGRMLTNQIDPSLTIKFTGTKTISTAIPKTDTKLTTIAKPAPKKTVTKTKTTTVKTTTVKTTTGKTSTVNLIPDKGISGPPKLLTEKAFIHGMYGGTMVESPVTGKLTPSLDALYPVNPDMITGLTRQAAQCVIDNAPRWVTYTFNGEKLVPVPTGEAIEVQENEGLVIAVSQNDGCQLEGVFKSKPKANSLQLNNKGWNLYAMQPELEGKRLTDLQCPAGSRVTEAYSLQSGTWTEISQWELRDGASGNIWWTQSVFVRCD